MCFIKSKFKRKKSAKLFTFFDKNAELPEGSIIYSHNPTTYSTNTADTDIAPAVFFDIFFSIFLMNFLYLNENPSIGDEKQEKSFNS